MNWEKFHNRLSKDAEGQNNEIDIESIWTAIEPQVDEINIEKKKKRRRVFFWWGTGVLLLSVGVWLLGDQFTQKEIIVQNTDKQNITTKTKHGKKETKANLNETTESTNGDDLQNRSISPNSNTTRSNFSKNKNQSKLTQSSVKPPQLPISNVVSNDNRSIKSTSASVSAISTDEELILRGSHSLKDAIRVKENILDISSLISFLDFPSEKVSLENEEKFWESTIETSLLKNSRNQFSIGIYVGANHTNRTLEEKNENSNTLLQIRETLETPLETSQVGFNFSYKILNKENYNLEITTGLQLTSIAERYKYYSTKELKTDFFGVEYLSYGLRDEPVEIMGWITKTKTTEYRKKIFNRYLLVDIPLLIGYNHFIGKKWQAGIQAGIFANLLLKTEGTIPSSNSSDIDLSNGDGVEIFKSNIGLSYQLGFNFKRKLTKHWELSFSPSVRFFGNDFASDDYGLSQKYVLLGGNVGVKYNF